MCPSGSQGSNSDHKQRRPISVSHIVLGLLANILKGGGEEEVKDKKLQFEADMIIYLKKKMKDESLTMVLDIKLE